MKQLLSIPIAHRGLHDREKPENSVAAFRAAAEAGYAIETDVRFTKNGALVVFHDDNFSRMAGDPRAVIGCTLQEIKALRLGGTEETVPTFEEFLRAAGNAPLLIEIKNMEGVSGERIAEALAEEIDRIGIKNEYAIQSFQPLYVAAYKKLRPSVPCGLLSSAHPPLDDFKPPFRRIKRYVVKHMCLNFKIKPDFISYYFGDFPSPETKKYRGPVLAWTIRSEAEEQQARNYAQNIIFERYLAKK